MNTLSAYLRSVRTHLISYFDDLEAQRLMAMHEADSATMEACKQREFELLELILMLNELLDDHPRMGGTNGSNDA